MKKPKTEVNRRVRKFQINKNSECYKQLDELCFRSKNIYNYTLHILKMLWLASDSKAKNPPEFYLEQIPEDVRKFVVKTTKEKANKKSGESETRNYYNIVVKSSTGGTITDEKALFMIFGTMMNQVDFRSLQTCAARGAVKLAVKSVKSFKSALVDYFKNPEKYLGKPEFPKYKGKPSLERKDGRTSFSIENFKTNKDDGTITINNDCELDSVFIDKTLGKVKQIRVIPKHTLGIFTVEVVYEFGAVPQTNGENIMGIDIGVNNLAVITISDIDGNIIDTSIINGRPLKSINQFYNKEVAKLYKVYSSCGNTYTKKGKDGKEEICMKSGKKLRTLDLKRSNKIETYMHQSSRMVINLAKKHHVGHIFIGHNPEWKQKCNLGRVNNQSFVQIPFSKFTERIAYKGKFEGISVEEIDESYTSKCSAIDCEEICQHDVYAGKRGGKHNKEFITKNGILINADVNGSLNILRKGLNKLTEGKTNNVHMNQTVFTPTKINVGFQKIDENAVQNSLSENSENMSGSCLEKQTVFLKQEATVDSRNDEESPFKKNFYKDSLHLT